MVAERTRRRIDESHRRPGVREVAKLAGVSPATVSRVLNHSPSVTPETRAKIQTAIESLNYVRYGVAKSFSQRRSGCVGVIVPKLGNSVYAEAVEAIEQRLQHDKYHLLIASSGYDRNREYEQALALVEHGVDGLVLVGDDHVPELHELLRQAAIPVVQTFIHAPASQFPSIGFDNFAPMAALINYVMDLGHRKFAILHSPIRHNDRIATRLNAIMTALSARGAAPDPELVIEAGVTVAGGRAGLRALLATGREFTALTCTGDVLAVGALIEARSAGIDVPSRLSVVGFHDYDLASQIEPPLTTVHAPIQEMSIAAAQYLLSRMAGENPPRSRELSTAMVVRKSVAPVPIRAATASTHE